MSITPPREDLQPIDWTVIDDTIFDWVIQQSDLNDSQVIMENQNIPQPEYPFASILRQSEVDASGIDEKRYKTIDSSGKIIGEDSGAGEPYTNQEIIYQPINFTVTIQFYVDFENGSTDSSLNALAKCSKLKRSIGLTSVRDNFNSNGFSAVKAENIQDLSERINGDWINRAAIDIIFRTASILSENSGFIDKTQIQSEQLDVDVLIDAS